MVVESVASWDDAVDQCMRCLMVYGIAMFSSTRQYQGFRVMDKTIQDRPRASSSSPRCAVPLATRLYFSKSRLRDDKRAFGHLHEPPTSICQGCHKFDQPLTSRQVTPGRLPTAYNSCRHRPCWPTTESTTTGPGMTQRDRKYPQQCGCRPGLRWKSLSWAR